MNAMDDSFGSWRRRASLLVVSLCFALPIRAAEPVHRMLADELAAAREQEPVPTGTTYGLRGKTPVIRGTGKRFGCNMISTVTNRGRLAFMVFKERFTAQVMITFLKRLTRYADHKVFLILDRHPVHSAAKVTRWAERHADAIELFCLPGSSPPAPLYAEVYFSLYTGA